VGSFSGKMSAALALGWFVIGYFQNVETQKLQAEEFHLFGNQWKGNLDVVEENLQNLMNRINQFMVESEDRTFERSAKLVV
jgi:hypothetical protein